MLKKRTEKYLRNIYKKSLQIMLTSKSKNDKIQLVAAEVTVAESGMIIFCNT